MNAKKISIVNKIVTALNAFIREEDIEKEMLNMTNYLNEYFNHSILVLNLKWI